MCAVYCVSYKNQSTNSQRVVFSQQFEFGTQIALNKYYHSKQLNNAAIPIIIDWLF